MEYLFFDIECCDGKQICEFGYVITDAAFTPIKKDIILINPDAVFNLGWSAGPKLFYKFSQYRAAKKFPKYYDEIRALMKGDRTVVGYATYNDARFLHIATERYGLPTLAFKYMDVQKLFKKLFPESKTCSLETACTEMGVDSSAYFHKSDDDAMMTALVLKRMTERTGKSVNELMDNACRGEITAEGKIIDADVVTFDDRLARAKNDETNKLNANNKRVLDALAMHVRPAVRVENSPLKGKRVMFSRNYEKNHFREMLAITCALRDRGGRYTAKSGECNTFVRFDEYAEDGSLKECTRLNTVTQANALKPTVKIITLGEFFSMLDISESELKNAPFPADKNFFPRSKK